MIVIAYNIFFLIIPKLRSPFNLKVLITLLSFPLKKSLKEYKVN